MKYDILPGWENKYSPSLLKEGFELYKAGNYKVVSEKTNEIVLRFIRYPYVDVKLTRVKDAWHVICDCFEARYVGGICAHEVAIYYYAVNGRYKLQHDTSLPIMPFKKINNSDYHYFDMVKMIDNVRITENSFNKAKALIDAGRVLKIKTNTFDYHDRADGRYTGIELLIDFIEDDGETKSKVFVRTSREQIWQVDCNCRCCYFHEDYNSNYYAPKYEICEHTVAAMILLDEYVRLENPGDATDYYAKLLLGRYVRQNNQSTQKIENVFLEPELQNDDGELRAGFRIGTDKGYKVKNLTDLVDAVEENSTIPLGKTNSINFNLNGFDEKSRPLYEFIHKCVKDNKHRNERIEARLHWGYSSRYVTETITDRIPLEGSAIDEFYELCRDIKELPYVEKKYGRNSVKGKITCLEGMPKAFLRIEKLLDGKEVAGIELKGHVPMVTEGSGSVYYTDMKHFYKSTEDDFNRVKNLLDFADSQGDIKFRIGRRYMGEFYHNVLPTLSQIAVIEDKATAQIENLIPPAPEFLFYLDRESQVISCRAVVSYGDNEHSPMDVKSKKGFAEIYRDYGKESEVCALIDDYFPIFSDENAHKEAFCEDPDGCYRIYREGLDELVKYGEVSCTDRFQNLRIRNSFGLKIGISVESDLLNLDITSNEFSKDELIAIFESYRLKKKYHVLRNGDFLDMESPDIAMLDQILKCTRKEVKAILGDKLKLPMYRALYLDKLLSENEELYSHRDRMYRKIIKDFGTVKDSDLEIPGELENVLRNYQVFGHKWLRTVKENGFGGILADEMGLGKTLQVISVLLAEKLSSTADSEVNTALIVCPASLVYNWEIEFNRFAPELKVCVVAEGARERHKQIKEYNKADVLITSYDLLKRDIAEYEDCDFAYQVIDEAQYIKNPKTAAAKSVKAVKSRYRFALTGTPIENRLSELWSIFDYLMPGFLFEYETFRKEMEIPIAKDKNEEVSLRLKKMVAPFILRRLKMDVLKDLPEKTEELRYAVMEQSQRALYNAQVQKISKKLEAESDAEFNKGKIQILAEITRTRQLCCDPGLVVEDYSGESAKRAACLELIQSAIEGEHRMLVFSQFTSMLDLLAKDLAENDIKYYMLTGSTLKEERIRLMEQFNKGDVPVFLISLKAGGTGLNLTGADIVIHYDPWWNLAVQNQATDRAHRIGQTKNVTVYKLIIKDSIEEKIVKLQESKKDLADEILNGENGTLGSLSREDLMELLS